jgi:hypothetical protein
MFNNPESDFNAKYNFTCKLSTQGVDGSPGVVARGNDSGGPYEVQPCCKKSLVIQLSNIV